MQELRGYHDNSMLSAVSAEQRQKKIAQYNVVERHPLFNAMQNFISSALACHGMASARF